MANKTSQVEVMPEDRAKQKLTLNFMPNFSMPRLTDGWSECRALGIDKYLNYSVPDGTYFDESKVIDEYSKFLKQAATVVETLEELYNLIASENDLYVTFNNSETITDQFVIENGQTVELDLGKDVVLTGEGNIGSNGRIFQVTDGNLIVNNGKVVSPSDTYGVFRVEADGQLEVNDSTLENSKGWGLNVKVLGGKAVLNDVTINSTTGGGIEVTEADLGTHSQAGYAELNNCIFTQTGYQDHCSTCLSVSGGSKLVINSGTYTSENYCLYVFSSGGEIEIFDGTFVGNKDGVCIKAAVDLNTYTEYTGGLKIHGGKFVGNAEIDQTAYMVIDGGEFTFDPTPYVDTSKHTVTELNGVYTVK